MKEEKVEAVENVNEYKVLIKTLEKKVANKKLTATVSLQKAIPLHVELSRAKGVN